jgi:hypothetical protein
MHPEVEELTYRTDDGESSHYDVPPLQMLRTYRIIVTTGSSAWLFRDGRLSRDHLTHVFVDEAGQALDPDLLIPRASSAKGPLASLSWRATTSSWVPSFIGSLPASSVLAPRWLNA